MGNDGVWIERGSPEVELVDVEVVSQVVTSTARWSSGVLVTTCASTLGSTIGWR
jgi:hypothetical protein